MKFIVDECTGPNVAKWLTQQGNDVYSVADESHGISDEQVLEKAVAEQRILITNDKDFGEMIFKQHLPPHA
jgi:predicted nuclease of predicted toxin-antitoxin system